MKAFNNIEALARRYGAIIFLTFSSQLASAFAAFTLPLLGLSVSDVYSLGVQVGTGAFSGFVMGVIYLLAIGRKGFRRWREAQLGVVFISLALAVSTLTSPSLSKLIVHQRLIWPGMVILAFAVGGCALGTAGIAQVRAACSGRPRGLAIVTVVPNLGLVASVLTLRLLRHTSGDLLALPAVCWSALCILTASLSAILDRRLSADVIPPYDESENFGMYVEALFLTIGVFTSTFVPIMLLSAVTVLHAGATTLLFIITRIGSAGVGLAVNSILMVDYSWSQISAKRSVLSPRLIIISVVSGGVGFLFEGVKPVYFSYLLVGVSWLSSLVAGPLVLRAANVNRKTFVISAKVLVDLLFALLVIYLLKRSPTVTGYLSAFIISQSITFMICQLGERSWLKAFLGLLNCGLGMGLLLQGW